MRGVSIDGLAVEVERGDVTPHLHPHPDRHATRGLVFGLPERTTTSGPRRNTPKDAELIEAVVETSSATGRTPEAAFAALQAASPEPGGPHRRRGAQRALEEGRPFGSHKAASTSTTKACSTSVRSG